MNDNILITQYFYPLPEGGTKKFFGGIYFDNPRTKSEIKFVADYIKKINYSSNMPFPEKDSQVPKDCITLWWIIDNIYKNNQTDKTINRYYKQAKKMKNVYYALAKMWIIIRCDELLDEKALDKIFFITTNATEKEIKPTLPPNNVLSYERIEKLLKFLSFMTNDNGNVNYSIILNNLYDLDGIPKFHNFFPIVLTTCTIDKKDNRHEYKPPLVTFDLLFECYNKYIEMIGEKYKDEKFLFICDTICNFCDLALTKPRMYLLGIVGIIEMLLTHNPDTSMYNIEDSISKQYIRKLKFILFKNDPSIDLSALEKELKLSYKIRSDIAHGNFNKDSEKNLKVLLDFYNLKLGGKGMEHIELDDGISYLNDNLTKYTRVLLDMFLTNQKELELIKDL